MKNIVLHFQKFLFDQNYFIDIFKEKLRKRKYLKYLYTAQKKAFENDIINSKLCYKHSEKMSNI
jgi:hypothetical protein